MTMKKSTFLSILILLISISINVKSQNYIPFPPDPTSEWRIDEQWWNWEPYEETTYWFKRLFFSGDILINGNEYHKQYFSGFSEYHNSLGNIYTYIHENVYVGAFRTEGSKLFFANPSNTEELVFDYSIQVGDTVSDCLISEWCADFFIVASIDSIQIGERYHRRYNFECTNPDYNLTYFIEGIGNDYGIKDPACMHLEYGTQLLCYAENGIPVFPENANCILTVSVDEFVKNDLHFEIYPNPAFAQVTISMNSVAETITSLNVSDLTGRILIHDFWKQTQGNNTISLDLHNLKPGIYIVTISGNDLTSTSQKKLIIF